MMFDQLLTRITSPNSRRRHTYHCSNTETHSDPENEVHQETTTTTTQARKPRLLERRKRGRRSQENNGLRQARSLGRLDGLKEAEKLADYSRHLGASQPTLIDGRKRDLDRIQDLFPQDFLGLHDVDAFTTQMTQKTKSSIRKKAATAAALIGLGRENSDRFFIMEAPCGMSCPRAPNTIKPRHLFLFSDLLLVAKPRSGGTFKLKESVRVSEVWLASCPDTDTGFLIGWPAPARTLLANFCTQAARDTWWRELQNALSVQLRREPALTNIKVVYRDPSSGTECSKTLGVGPEINTAEIARLTLDSSHEGSGGSNSTFTLWARDRDKAPCPLLGCERPHSIQLARLRQSICAEEGFDLAHCNKSRAPCGIVFELKATTTASHNNNNNKTKKKPNRVFGVPLSRLCLGGTLPQVLNIILRGLVQRGPHTQGIFRRCASAKALRELREKIDVTGGNYCDELKGAPALLLAALLKDFLRSLPEPLLAGSVSEWLTAGETEHLDHLRSLVGRLPRENHLLLAHVICVLYLISKRARYNLMSAANLGVCVGPSLLWADGNLILRSLPRLIELLILKCEVIFGPQVTSLYGEGGVDSGAEESDSFSLHSMGLSLEDQKSLSRDSGLTLSEDDRESPGLTTTWGFQRSDWSRQAARLRSMDSSWTTDDEAFGASSESLCGPPIPPRRPPTNLRHLPPVYRAPPPPPPTYANESYV